MKVLVACEYSGRVRDAFIKNGHDAISCDMLDSESDLGDHIKGDLFNSGIDFSSFDLMIAHPPCTYLSVSGLHWNKRNPERATQTDEALAFVSKIGRFIILRICIENPVGCINSRLPDMPKPQYIQPYDFGEDASKKTGLWLKGLPPLVGTSHMPGRIVNHEGKQRTRWANQTDSGQNKLGPSADRWKIRSLTYLGIAEAMANQWGRCES